MSVKLTYIKEYIYRKLYGQGAYISNLRAYSAFFDTVWFGDEVTANDPKINCKILIIFVYPSLYKECHKVLIPYGTLNNYD